jgi:hypothetical protein
MRRRLPGLRILSGYVILSLISHILVGMGLSLITNVQDLSPPNSWKSICIFFYGELTEARSLR